jgi:hypothetical protein
MWAVSCSASPQEHIGDGLISMTLFRCWLSLLWVVYQYGSSIISGERQGKLPEVTAPEAALTITGSHGSDRVRMHSRFPHFFLTIVVVQNVPLRMTDRATGNDRRWSPWKGVRMCNRKLRNIHPSGAFWPEVTSSNVTRPLRSSLGRVGYAHVQLEVGIYPY